MQAQTGNRIKINASPKGNGIEINSSPNKKWNYKKIHKQAQLGVPYSEIQIELD